MQAPLGTVSGVILEPLLKLPGELVGVSAALDAGLTRLAGDPSGDQTPDARSALSEEALYRFGSALGDLDGHRHIRDARVEHRLLKILPEGVLRIVAHNHRPAPRLARRH